jgi:hypothetical protein
MFESDAQLVKAGPWVEDRQRTEWRLDEEITAPPMLA